MVVTRKRKTDDAGLDKVADTTPPKIITKGRKSKRLVDANDSSECTQISLNADNSVIRNGRDLPHLETLSPARPTTSVNAEDKINSKSSRRGNFKENARGTKSSYSKQETEMGECASSQTQEPVFHNTGTSIGVNQTGKVVASISKLKTKSTSNKKPKGCTTKSKIKITTDVCTTKIKNYQSLQNSEKNICILQLPPEYKTKTSCQNSGTESDESSQNSRTLSEVRAEICESKTTGESEVSESNANSHKKYLLKKPAPLKPNSTGQPKKAAVTKIKKRSHKNDATSTVAADEKQAFSSKDGSSSESEWEDVAEAEQEMDLDDYNPDIPKEGVQITIEDPFLQKKRMKHQFDFAAYARRQINRFKKDVQLSLHKVHLLCFIASGIFVNCILNRELLRGVALSLLPPTLKIPKKTNLSYLSKFIDWYREEFTCMDTVQMGNENFQLLEAELLRTAETRKALTIQNYCLLFVIMGRVLGLDVRLCIAVNPISFKAKNLLTKKRKIECVDITGDHSGSNEETEGQSTKSKTLKSKKTDMQGASNETTGNVKNCTVNISDGEVKGQRRKSKSSKTKKNVLPGKSTISKNQEPKTLKKVKLLKNRAQASLSDCEQSNTSRSQRRRASLNVSYKDDAGTDDDISNQSDDNFDPTNVSDQSDDNFQPKSVTFRKPTHSMVRVISDQRPASLTKLKKANREILSSDSDDEDVGEFKAAGSGRLCVDYWAEVYLLQEKKWVCVDCFHNIVDKPYEIESNTSHQISYVLSYNKDSCVKDVTWRYASAWLTDVRKLRVDTDWWDETLEPFAPPNDKKDKEENKQIQATLMDKPLPSTMSEFKNHPLYVLKRHLLKFEGLYPPDAPSLGFIRGEAVYGRECVHTLHSREIWRKQARSVKVGEQPYKIVKARPKWDKMALKIRTDIPLEVFGEWQTEKYIPPTAKDGKVPRNEYGNVELFKPEMLPKGTVHIQLPALNRVARKLGIDCSPAVVGFEAHHYGAGPVFDGWVVCKEFKETLILAWDEEQVNIRKKEQEKREKRIYGNWKRLIKGLLIREKIKAKYLNTEASGSSAMS